MNDFKKQEDTKKYYNETEYYDNNLEVFSNLNSKFQKYRLNKVFEIYKPQKGERVLDMGCGWGTFSFANAKICEEVVGIDFSKKSVDICNGLLKKHRFSNVKFFMADATTTGLESEYFDTIICADIVEHLYPEVFIKVMDECQRLLKGGGRIVIWTPDQNHFLEIMRKHNFIFKRDESHVDFKNMKTLTEELTSRDFDILKAYYAESNWPVLRAIEKLFLKYIPLLRRRIAVLAQKK